MFWPDLTSSEMATCLLVFDVGKHLEALQLIISPRLCLFVALMPCDMVSELFSHICDSLLLLFSDCHPKQQKMAHLLKEMFLRLIR